LAAPRLALPAFQQSVARTDEPITSAAKMVLCSAVKCWSIIPVRGAPMASSGSAPQSMIAAVLGNAPRVVTSFGTAVQ